VAGEAKRSEKFEAKRSEKVGFLFSLEHAKTKRNRSYFASFRFEAEKIFKRNRRTLLHAMYLLLERKSKSKRIYLKGTVS
jgi:hypothetical protein